LPNENNGLAFVALTSAISGKTIAGFHYRNGFSKMAAEINQNNKK
jgi:hypothetical protein